MFNKNLGVLFLVAMSAIANVRAYAAGGYTHMYIAQQAFLKTNDEEIRRTIGSNLEAYYLGAHFPDVGQMSSFVNGLIAKIADTVLLVPLAKGLPSKISGKNYGEITHWDDFLDEYKNFGEIQNDDRQRTSNGLCFYPWRCNAQSV
jgi:hypothetical protein